MTGRSPRFPEGSSVGWLVVLGLIFWGCVALWWGLR